MIVHHTIYTCPSFMPTQSGISQPWPPKVTLKKSVSYECVPDECWFRTIVNCSNVHHYVIPKSNCVPLKSNPSNEQLLAQERKGSHCCIINHHTGECFEGKKEINNHYNLQTFRAKYRCSLTEYMYCSKDL